MLNRRDFLRDGIVACVAFVAVACSPNKKHARSTSTTRPDRSFGGRIDVGSVDRLRAEIAASGEPSYIPEARAYVSPFPADLADAARGVYPDPILPLLAAGIVVLYQRCTHLGCRVPWCATSQWFECPCHDAKFDRVGEQRHGPAPHGLDLMVASIEQGRLVIDTGTILRGVTTGTDTTHQAAAGPFCV